MSDTTLASNPDLSDGAEVENTDPDFDGVPHDDDNCPAIYNPTQVDLDDDGIGDACDDTLVRADDQDGDTIPDLNDPFPDDGTRPGVVSPSTIYVHTSTELYRLEMKTNDVFLVHAFVWPSNAESTEMTDIAVDRYGVMYGISFDDVFAIDPKTAECWRLAALPQEFNGLTLVPKGVTGQANDTLVGISNDGGWWRMNLVPTTPPSSQQRVELTFFGEYGSGWQSSGDAFSIEGIGTFATIDTGEFSSDTLARIDPTSGAVQNTLTNFGLLSRVWGLAGWTNTVYAFDEGGEMLVIDLATGDIVTRKNLGKTWWGAGVRTVIDE